MNDATVKISPDGKYVITVPRDGRNMVCCMGAAQDLCAAHRPIAERTAATLRAASGELNFEGLPAAARVEARHALPDSYDPYATGDERARQLKALRPTSLRDHEEPAITSKAFWADLNLTPEQAAIAAHDKRTPQQVVERPPDPWSPTPFGLNGTGATR